jgi:hypothetical protein
MYIIPCRTLVLVEFIFKTSRRNGRRNALVARKTWKNHVSSLFLFEPRMQCAFAAAGESANLDARSWSNDLLVMNLRGRQLGLSAWFVSSSTKDWARYKGIFAASLLYRFSQFRHESRQQTRVDKDVRLCWRRRRDFRCEGRPYRHVPIILTEGDFNREVQTLSLSNGIVNLVYKGLMKLQKMLTS